MPEDEGINGDRWTDEAGNLLAELRWEKVADSNIDIEGADGIQHGIDSLYKYPGGFDPAITEGVFLEAKRYKTTSLEKSKLQGWVDTLDKKMLELRRSEDFLTNYPGMAGTEPRNALLALWFHDIEEYAAFAPKLRDWMASLRPPRRRRVHQHRLFVIHNEGILRLASLVDALKDLRQENEVQSLVFQYPSRQRYGNPAVEAAHLSLEYMFSKLVFAKMHLAAAGAQPGPTVDIVFHFGGDDIRSMARLKAALMSYGMLNASNELFIFQYSCDHDQFRKIEPDLDSLFEKPVQVRPMRKNADLPPWMQRTR